MKISELYRAPTWKMNIRSFWLLLKLRANRALKNFQGVKRIRFFFSFISYMLLTSFFFFGKKGKALILEYAWFRTIDDIMDGDENPPKGYTKESYLLQKEKIISSLPNLKECQEDSLPEDIFLVSAMEIVPSSVRNKVMEDMKNLWKVMRWDDGRREALETFSREKLNRYARLQDKSILGLSLSILGRKRHHLSMLDSLQGLFTRIDWLTDIVEDINNRTINIPKESIKKYKIKISSKKTYKNLEDLLAVPGFAAWYKREVATTAREAENAKIKIKESVPLIFPIFFALFAEKILIKILCGISKIHLDP